jgi:hypothetical protein
VWRSGDGTLRAALQKGTSTPAKTVLQAMIEGIRVDVSDQIELTFRVQAVRIDFSYTDAGLAPPGRHRQ